MKNLQFYALGLAGILSLPASLHAELAITEFLASNDDILADDDGDFSDWIEILNTGTTSIDVGGWILSDSSNPDFDELSDAWVFPSRILEAGARIVVFASGKNRSPADGELHASFSISAGGGDLGLYAPGADLPTSSFADYPEQFTDISYGAVTGSETQGYFGTPTPGDENDALLTGIVEDTRFDVDRGFFSDPFTVNVTSGTLGSTIIYTTDGSAPTLENGTAVAPTSAEAAGSAAITIGETTVLRAAAIKDGLLPTNTDTQSYIFLADVLQQDNTPEGYPIVWKDQARTTLPADYEMDPEIVDDPVYSGQMIEAMRSVPTVSLVTDIDNLFDTARGIYQNPQQFGARWERPVSMEILYPDEPERDTQIDAGIRIQGGHTRNPSNNPKHSFRVIFRNDYGASKFEHDLFKGDPTATTTFDELILRGGGNQSWVHHNEFKGDNRGRAQYLRDQWAKDTQKLMSPLALRNIYAHLYINGLYWGLYNPTERASAGFGESYLEGDSSGEIYALNSGEEVDGGTAAEADYEDLRDVASRIATDPEAYAEVESRLDLTAFADYMILNQYGGNLDWDHHNWYAIRKNVDGGKWYFIAWDNEFMFIENRDNVLALSNTQFITAGFFNRLIQNDEFRILFNDRIQKHLRDGGLLTEEAVVERWNARRDQMFSAILGESARWGDYRRDVHSRGDPRPIPLYDRDGDWFVEYDRLIDSYFPQRTATTLRNYTSRTRIPYLLSTPAPVFDVPEGKVAAGTLLTIGDEGEEDTEIVYTLDGSDPREEGAILYSGDPLKINQATHIRARLRGTPDNSEEWGPLSEKLYVLDTPAAPGTLLVTEIMYNPDGPDSTEFIEVMNIAPEAVDLSSVKFVQGITCAPAVGITLPSCSRGVFVQDRDAFVAEYGLTPTILGTFEDDTRLADGGERIALATADTLKPFFDFSYDDSSAWPSAADGAGRSLVLNTTSTTPDYSDPSSWIASDVPGGTPGTGEDIFVFSGTPDADEDGDGLSAFLEYALGTDDSETDSAAFLEVSTEEGVIAARLYARLAACDVKWIAETSSDMITWESGEEAAATFRSSAPDPENLMMTTLTWDLDPENVKFFRVRAATR